MDLNKHKLVQLYIENNNFGRLLKMDFDIEKPGVVKYTMPVESLHLATPIAAHGGAISALMDATMGVCALTCVIEDGKVVSTIEFKISYISPAYENDMLNAEAEVIKKGNKLLFIKGDIKNQKNELVATATGTFNSYPYMKAGFKKG